MKIVLINPTPESFEQKWDRPGFPPLSLGYLAASLRRNGIEPLVLDGKLEGLELGRMADRLAGIDAQIFGLTAMTHEIADAAKLATRIKAAKPGSTVIVGGCHAMAMPERTLQEFGSFDIAAFGEGESSLVEIVRALEDGRALDGIEGIAFREDGRVRLNVPRPWLSNLDELPEPAWDLFPRTRTYPVISTRGCPFRCAFCMRVLGGKVRFRSPENVVDEVGHIIEGFGPEEIIFYDETFTLRRERIHRILDMMIERGYHKKMRWIAQTRVNECDEALLAKMAKAGCHEIDFGIESGNPEMLKSIGKGITLDDARRAVRMAKKVGIEVVTLFILGHPNETRKTAMDTINFAVELNGDRLALGIMVPYPGTEVARMAGDGEGGYRLLSHDWSDFNKYFGNALEIEGLPRAELEKLQAWGYLKFYLWNLRFLDLFRVVLSRWREAAGALRRLSSRRLQSG